MSNKTRKLHVPNWRKPRYDKRDLWLAVWSLLAHLVIFMLLPQLATQAAARVELQIELVQPQQRLEKPARPQPNPAGETLAQPQNSPPTEQPSTAEAEPAAKQPQTSPDDSAGTGPTVDSLPTPTDQDAYTMPAIPEILSTPTHQPRKVTPPVVSGSGPPAPVDTSRTESKPPAEDTAVKAPQTPTETTDSKPAPVSPADVPATNPVEQTDPADTTGEPSETAQPVPGAGVPNDGPPTPPPGPSELELGLLEEYGDYARKRIKMLARTPERAKEQKLKGTTEFEFEIAADGTLLGVKVINSSGQPILDEECLEATKVASTFKRFPANIKVASWKFRMKLTFPIY